MTGPIGCRLDGPTGREGRFGNQLWRAASTIGIAFDHATEPRFNACWRYRHVMCLPDEWFVPVEELGSFLPVESLPDVAHIPGPFRGYLQDVSLWWHHGPAVRRVMRPSRWARTEIDQASMVMAGMDGPVLGLHVRRGDCVTNPPGTINALLPVYYQDAYRHAVDYQGIGAFGSIMIVTDDPEWCEEQFVHRYWPGPLDVRVLHGIPRSKEHAAGYLTETPRDWVDLFVLAGFSSHVLPAQVVISNSSFAWWAAFIGGHPNPVRPSYWCGGELIGAGCDPSLLWPPGWTNVVKTTDPSVTRSGLIV